MEKVKCINRRPHAGPGEAEICVHLTSIWVRKFPHTPQPSRTELVLNPNNAELMVWVALGPMAGWV